MANETFVPFLIVIACFYYISTSYYLIYKKYMRYGESFSSAWIWDYRRVSISKGEWTVVVRRQSYKWFCENLTSEVQVCPSTKSSGCTPRWRCGIRNTASPPSNYASYCSSVIPDMPQKYREKNRIQNFSFGDGWVRFVEGGHFQSAYLTSFANVQYILPFSQSILKK